VVHKIPWPISAGVFDLSPGRPFYRVCSPRNASNLGRWPL